MTTTGDPKDRKKVTAVGVVAIFLTNLSLEKIKVKFIWNFWRLNKSFLKVSINANFFTVKPHKSIEDVEKHNSINANLFA